MKFKLVVYGLIIFMGACAKKEKANAQVKNTRTVYKESKEDFPNPERGFYKYSQTKASDFTVLTAEQLNAWKKPVQPANGNYSVFTTLIFRYYVLDLFRDQPLSASFLDAVNLDFAAARQAGFKLIPRFTYTLTQTAGSCPEGFICPPYGDAPKSIVLQHISQLKQLLHDNADVIAVVQMGFIGVWGENITPIILAMLRRTHRCKNCWIKTGRTELMYLRALLDATPKDRMVQVRYPQIKQRFVHGINADVKASPLQESEAFLETDKARIGHHNDCFLASETDYGTFEDYGNSSSPRTDANTAMRIFKKNDSKFVAVGGETCSDTYSPQNDCEPIGKAQTEMREMHYSYLNSDYNNQVNNDWQTAGCMDSIKKNLGYRFVLKESTVDKSVKAGKSFRLSFSVETTDRGYASPFNSRPLKLVLRNKQNKKETIMLLAADVRKWFPGSHIIVENIQLPSDIAKGECDLFFFLPDQHASIQDRPEFAIRFANENVWEPATGYNNMNTTLTIL